MIIHNYIHQVLVDVSEKQGWNEESQILHLCGFICWVRRNGPLYELTQPKLEEKWQGYLQAVADEENAEGDE